MSDNFNIRDFLNSEDMSEQEIDRCEFWVLANAAVRKTGKHNFEEARIQVNGEWNFDYIETELKKCKSPDVKFLLDMFRFGWPLNAESTQEEGHIPPNQKGARDNPEQIDKYLKKELKRGSIIGPFKRNPFGKKARFSPLDTRPKKDSQDLRVILNLSHPWVAGSVNHSISKETFLGKSMKIKYPTCDDLARIVRRKGRGCHIFKRDLEAAYCQMKMDAGDVHLLGFIVDGSMYFYVTLSMGSRSSCFCCQKTTDVITLFYSGLGFSNVNYLDDLGGAEIVSRAREAYTQLGGILDNMGIKEAEKKACPPSTHCTFLGIGYDTVSMTMHITEERLQEIKGLLESWLTWTHVSLHDVQHILGKLNFLCSTVRAGRIFVSRIINKLKDLPTRGKQEMGQDFRADLKWWHTFMDRFDGVTLIPDLTWKAPDVIISSDACLQAGGGWNEKDAEYWHARFPEELLENDVHINELETLALLTSLKIWRHKIRNSNILMYCDNQTTVDIVNSGSASNNFAQKCLRELCWITAGENAVVKVVHRPGVQNRIADFCSRMDVDDSMISKFKQETSHLSATEKYVFPGLFKFSHDW